MSEEILNLPTAPPPPLPETGDLFPRPPPPPRSEDVYPTQPILPPPPPPGFPWTLGDGSGCFPPGAFKKVEYH